MMCHELIDTYLLVGDVTQIMLLSVIVCSVVRRVALHSNDSVTSENMKCDCAKSAFGS